MRIHAYRVRYPDSPHASERRWEWDKQYTDRLLWNAKTFGCEVVQRYYPDWDALAQEHQRIRETYYLPRPRYELWETWQAWLTE